MQPGAPFLVAKPAVRHSSTASVTSPVKIAWHKQALLTPAATTKTDDNPLDTIRTKFLESNVEALPQALVRTVDQVIVYANGQLALWKVRGIQDLLLQTALPVVSLRYDINKSLSHIPIIIHNYMASTKCPYTLAKKLRALYPDCIKLLDLAKHTVSAEDYTRHQQYLSPIIMQLQHVQRTAALDPEEMKRLMEKIYVQGMAILRDKLIPDASHDILRVLLQQLSSLEDHYQLDWQQTEIMTVTVEGARRNHIEHTGMQHYLLRKGVEQPDRRMHLLTFDPLREKIDDAYMQHLILQRLAQNKLQQDIAGAILQDEKALSSDVLYGEHVHKSLETLCPHRV